MDVMSRSRIINKEKTMAIKNKTTDHQAYPSGGDAPGGFSSGLWAHDGRVGKALGVSRQTINEVLREKRAMSPVMALRLGQLLGNAPGSGLKPSVYDLWQAKRGYRAQIEKIKPLRAA